MRLENAAVHREVCGGEDAWDGDDNAPDVYVRVTDNWDGVDWTSDVRQNAWSPEWSQAVWTGASASGAKLMEWGISVELLDEDLLGEAVILEESVQLEAADIDERAFVVKSPCAFVTFSLLPA